MTKEMGESSLIGDLIRMPLPNEGFAEYPAIFAFEAINFQKYSIFIAKGIGRKTPSLLMATTNTGTRAIIIGDYNKLSEQLLDIQWQSDRVMTSIGEMFRKVAPNHLALEKMIKLLLNTTK